MEKQKEIKKEKNIQLLAEKFITSKDERSFGALYERLKPGITNHCYSILKDFELAEDAFLTSMSKVWEKIDQYDKSKGNFSTWCYNIARNESLSIIKKNKKYIHLGLDELEYSSSKVEEKNPSYNIDDDPLWRFANEGNTIDDMYEIAIDEIKSLPAIYKDIMIDREINGMKYKDIADKYGIKKRSIATRIRRARNKIKKKMEEIQKSSL